MSQVGALRAHLIFSSDGSSVQTASWLGDYGILTPTAYLRLDYGTVTSTCFDGSNPITWATGVTDGYGLALAADGSLFAGQGTTNPATVWRVPPGGGAAVAVTTVPMIVVTVVADLAGNYVYVAGVDDGNTIWQIDVATGAKVVYGCDPSSTHACGATQ